jgi:hypothetical protein
LKISFAKIFLTTHLFLLKRRKKKLTEEGKLFERKKTFDKMFSTLEPSEMENLWRILSEPSSKAWEELRSLYKDCPFESDMEKNG